MESVKILLFYVMIDHNL